MNPYRVIFGAGAQALPFTPDGARITTASFAIENAIYSSGSDSRVLSSGTVLCDSFQATLTFVAGASQPDPRKIFLSTVAALQPGHIYELFHSSTNDVEPIELKSVGNDPVSGSFAFTLHPIYGRSFPTGSVLRGKELSITMPASIANDPQYIQTEPNRTLRLIISGSDANGFPCRIPRQIRITRTSTSDYSFDSVQKMIGSILPTNYKADGFDIKSKIDMAARLVESDLKKIGKHSDEVLLGGTGENLLVWKSCWLIAISPNTKNSETFATFAEIADKTYQREFDHLRIGTPQPDVKETVQANDTMQKKPRHNPFRSFGF